MIAKRPAAKRYIVALSADERRCRLTLNTLMHKGTNPTRQVLKERILLKAAASRWSVGQLDRNLTRCGPPDFSRDFRRQTLRTAMHHGTVLSCKGAAVCNVDCRACNLHEFRCMTLEEDLQRNSYL